MTSFKQSNFSNSSKSNGNFLAVPIDSALTTSQADSDLDRLSKEREEAIRRERIGLLEDQFVQAVCREKGISRK